MDHFGLLAPYYDRVIKPGDKNWLFEIIGLPAPGFLLDAGGGTGRITKLLQDQLVPTRKNCHFGTKSLIA
jgi:hypothetical protein